MMHPRFANSIIPDTAVRFQSVKIGDDLSLNRATAGICFYTSSTEEEINKELDDMSKILSWRLESLDMIFEGFSMTTRFFRFAETALGNPVLKQLSSSIEKVTGKAGEGIGSCLSDLPLFILHGSPRAVCFGAGRDFVKYGGAHQPDEFIECEKFVEFTQILADFLMHYGK